MNIFRTLRTLRPLMIALLGLGLCATACGSTSTTTVADSVLATPSSTAPTSTVSSSTVSTSTVSTSTVSTSTVSSSAGSVPTADIVVPVFFEPHLADAHTGPWGDAELGRCDGFHRTVHPVQSSVQHGGTTEADMLIDAFVTVVAEFATEDEAAVALDEIDLCHVPKSVNQFLQALGMVDVEVQGLGMQGNEIGGGMQIFTADYTGTEVEVAFAAVQLGNTVAISITIGNSIDVTIDHALDAAA